MTALSQGWRMQEAEYVGETKELDEKEEQTKGYQEGMRSKDEGYRRRDLA